MKTQRQSIGTDAYVREMRCLADAWSRNQTPIFTKEITHPGRTAMNENHTGTEGPFANGPFAGPIST